MIMQKNHVLLINPAIYDKSQNKKVSAIVNKTFPTSLGILAGFLMKHGVSVRILDEQVHPLGVRELEQAIEGLARPRIIGLSVLTMNCGRAYEISSMIHDIDPHTTVIFGGVHPTVVPEEPLGKRGVDLVIRGEGEEPLRDVVQAILSGQEYHHVLGLTYMRDGKILSNPDAPLINDLDTIPPFPYELFEEDMHAYPSFSGIIGSRGCPFKCTFCSARSISGLQFRFHSVERLISEMKILTRKYGQKSIHLMDDNIGVHRPHFLEMCDAIVKEGLHKDAWFHGSMRGDNATEEVLEASKRANFKILYFGLETGTERLMKVVDKGETLAEVVDAVHRATAKDIQIGATLIFGLPTETRAERYETMRVVDSLPLFSVRFNTLTPYPGTPVWHTEEKKGNVNIKGCWENFGVQYMWESDDIPYVPDSSDRLELMWDTMYANFANYLSPKGIWRVLTKNYAGGNVIKLESTWYLSFTEIRKMFNVTAYLLLRFLNVGVRLAFRYFVKGLRNLFSRIAKPFKRRSSLCRR
ncbi:MAG: radical SAM protein [Candidatus Omnitrophota bacterium]|nr:radical SAM protein [Candidatus Omnitrophota bacterium]